MKNVFLAVALLALSATPALAQDHPFPGSKSASPVLCTNCPGTNTHGEQNNGKPTYPYDTPLLAHVGRLVDSSNVLNYQNIGIRTVRAGKIRVAPSRNRIYVQLGEAVGVYALDTFFTSRLAQPLVLVNKIATGNSYRNRPELEKVHEPDGFFYAESPYSGWTISVLDSQKHLNDFDVDDRGYFYAASVYFGWGIHRENQDNTGDHLPFVAQLQQQDSDSIFAFRSGTMYYAAVSKTARDQSTLTLFDVTIPASPVIAATRLGQSHAVQVWAKDDTNERLALVGVDGVLHIHSYSGFVAGESALATLTPPTGKTFADVTFDEAGNVWAAEASISGSSVTTNPLWKLTPAGTGYIATSFDVYGGAFRPSALHVGSGYIAVGGRDAAGYDVRLLRIGSGGPELINTDGFFQKYYSVSPAGYAIPNFRYILPRAVRLITQGANTYLIYNAGGLGDAYRITTAASSITSLSPASGPPSGGTTVTIETVNVTGDATVTFGGVAATGTVVENGRIITTAPPHAPGSVDVKVVAGGMTLTAPQQFTYQLETPTNFTASATSTTSVSLTWDSVEGAAQYELSRRNADGTWTPLATTPSRSFIDSGLAAGSGYAYRLRALDSAGHASGHAQDLATTVALSTTTLAPGMVIRRAHIIELRLAANALRAGAGLAPVQFSETTFFRAADLHALRVAISEARAAHGLNTTLTEPESLLGVTIKAVHLQELLNAVR